MKISQFTAEISRDTFPSPLYDIFWFFKWLETLKIHFLLPKHMKVSEDVFNELASLQFNIFFWWISLLNIFIFSLFSALYWFVQTVLFFSESDKSTFSHFHALWSFSQNEILQFSFQYLIKTSFIQPRTEQKERIIRRALFSTSDSLKLRRPFEHFSLLAHLKC